MNEIAIRVENLSKAYRIGKTEQRHETLLGAVGAMVLAPVRNFRQLRRLTRFQDRSVKAGGGSRDVGRAQAQVPVGSVLGSGVERSGVEADAIWALRDISLEIGHGEVLGIIGGNGAGKSTLLRVLSRITEPTSGRAVVYGRVGSLLEVGTGFHPDLTGRENVYLNATVLGMKKREVDSKFDQIVEFSGVEKFIDTPVKRYSSGMRVRLAFAVAAHLEPEVLIVDEVLAVGDAAFQRKCLGRMREVSMRGRTVLFVSHDMGAISTLCNRVIVLQGGQVGFDGDKEKAILHYHSQFDNFDSEGGFTLLPNSRTFGRTSRSAIHRIEFLDDHANLVAGISTWDTLRIRCHYCLERDVTTCSIILDFRDCRGNRLCVFDSGEKIKSSIGPHIAECRISQFPLAAGEYFVGAGLADSRSEWIWRVERLGLVRVLGRDVFNLGRPPSSSRMAIAVPHDWREIE